MDDFFIATLAHLIIICGKQSQLKKFCFIGAECQTEGGFVAVFSCGGKEKQAELLPEFSIE